MSGAAAGQGSPVTHRAASGSSTLSSQKEKHPQDDSQERIWERFPLIRSKGFMDSALSAFFYRTLLSLLKGDVNERPCE